MSATAAVFFAGQRVLLRNLDRGAFLASYLLGLLLCKVGLVLIFVNTKQQATDTERFLSRLGMPVQSIHGDRTQEEREYALEQFKRGQAPFLVATDVAARGLDIPNVAMG